MPFVSEDISRVIEEKQNCDPAFKKVWDDSREEYRLIGKNVFDPIHSNYLLKLGGKPMAIVTIDWTVIFQIVNLVLLGLIGVLFFKWLRK